MTVQKKILDLTGSQYLVQKVKSAINDVDSSLSTHVADTDIHVTAADKTKWNNGVSQSYVLRYSSSSVTDNSTIAYSTLDNTDNIKSGDKVIDVDGKIFSIVSVDTANQTVTVGSALIDLALDGNVVHTSGNETVAGIKTFSDYTYIKALNFTNEVASPSSSGSAVMPILTTVTYTDHSPSQTAKLNFRISADGTKSLYPHENNQYALGLISRKWSEIHATTYYYGSSDVEFSNKFVTTDTDQTVGGNKIFSSVISSDGAYLGNESSTNERTNLCLRSNRDTANKSCAYISRFRTNKNQGELSDSDISFISISFLENETRYTRCFDFGLTDWDTDGVPQTYYLTSPGSKGSLGTSLRKWQLINGLSPSALSMPDLSNGIDISSYITHLDKVVNQYTPPVNGYINIRVKKTSLPIVSIRMQQLYGLMTSCETADFSTWGTCLPVIAGQIVEFYISADSLMSAVFFPCQGNV